MSEQEGGRVGPLCWPLTLHISPGPVGEGRQAFTLFCLLTFLSISPPSLPHAETHILQAFSEASVKCALRSCTSNLRWPGDDREGPQGVRVLTEARWPTFAAPGPPDLSS